MAALGLRIFFDYIALGLYVYIFLMLLHMNTSCMNIFSIIDMVTIRMVLACCSQEVL